ncbi:MAG: NAD(P)H-dependent oxidoreductase subunit E, partial [Propionivibrio sp.]|nr:NAD(P)H-dependent oxidoreductase subunit E [Propionivibrio sp.]
MTNPLPTQARLHALIDAHRTLPGATLPMLHAIQDSFGYVPDEALPMIASALNLSRAEIQGVVS